MPEATYSNAPTQPSTAYVSNPNPGFRMAHLVHGFPNPITGIRIFGLQGMNTVLGWMPMNAVDELTFEISFYTDNNGNPGTLIEDYTQVVTLSNNTTNEWFGEGFEIFYYDFYPSEPIKNLPNNFWISAVNIDMEPWFMWIDDPYGDDISMQYDIELGTWTEKNYPIGICIVPLPVSPSAPNEPTNLNAIPGDLGALSASITWNNPTTTFGGGALTELLYVELFVNDSTEPEYVVNNPVIGGEETYEYTAHGDGLYKFTVLGTNSYGTGLYQSKSVWLGNDVPAKPASVILSPIEGGALLQWDAPSTSLHGGYIDLPDIRYTITRFPEDIVVVQQFEGTEFADIFNPPIGSYYYKVSSTNTFGTGGSAVSNLSVLGAENVLLFEMFDEIPEGGLPDGWTSEGVGGANWWVYNSDFSGGNVPEMVLNWEPIFVGLSRLVTKPIELQGQEFLRISFKQYLDNYWPDGSTVALQVSFDEGEWINLWEQEIVENIPKEKAEFFFTVPTGANSARIGWEFNGDSYMIYAWFIDDVVVDPVNEHDLKAVSLKGDLLPTVGIENSYQAVVQNVGFASQSDYTVKLMKEGGVEVGSLDGILLEFGQTHEYQFVWSPEEEDESISFLYTLVVFDNDEYTGNNKSPNLRVHVQPEGTVITTIGDGNENVVLPYNFLREYSLSQTLYYNHEIGVGGGAITGLHYVNFFDEELTASNISIWIGETEATALSGGWIDPASLQLVFSGAIDFSQGIRQVYIPLQIPYFYSGKHLVIYSYKEDANTHIGKIFKNTYDQNSSRSRFISDGSPFNPQQPTVSGSMATDFYPNIGIYFNTSGLAVLQGVVTHNGEPIEGVDVIIEGTGLKATTLADGSYLFSTVTAGTYAITFSKIGYETHTQEDVEIEGGEITILNISLEALLAFTVQGIVKGNDGELLMGAKVFLDGLENFIVSTNSDGEFVIPNVYQGSYNLLITSYGYNSVFQNDVLVDNSIAVGEMINLGEFVLAETVVPPYLLSVDLDADHRDQALFQWDKTFSGTLLLVDHDASNVIPQYVDAGGLVKATLQQLGITFDVFESNSTPPYNGPSYQKMKGYDAVIWVSGEGWAQGQTMTSADMVNLSQYLDGGGVLLLSGQDFLYDVYQGAQLLTFTSGQFAYDYLGLRKVFQDQWWNGEHPTFHYQHASGSEGSFAQGLTLNLQNLYGGKEGLTTDNVLEHVGSPVIDINEEIGGIAALRYQNTVFTSANLEAMEDEQARAAFIMKGLTSFFEERLLKTFQGYTILLDGEVVATAHSNVEFLFTGLKPKTTYTAGVKSVFITGESPVKQISFTTYPPTSVTDGLLDNISVYPNPFGAQLIISDAERVKRLTISNILGQTVVDIELNGQSQVNTQRIDAGIYIITLEGQDGQRSLRRMIKR